MFSIRLIRWVWYLVATIIVLVALLVTVAHLSTPLLNKHRADFEAWASQLLQQPILIGKVHADWRGNIPELTFTHVVALDKQTQHPAFDMREIKLGIQLFSSIWKRKLILQDIIISGTEVTILQDKAGNFSIKDLPVQEGEHYQAYQLSSVLGWIFSQPYLALQDIDIQIVLAKGERHALDIEKVSLVNQGTDHKINGSFLLHQEIPTEIKARIEWTGSVTDAAHIKAQAYLNLEGVSLGQWLHGKNPIVNRLFSGWQIHQGIGGMDLWLKWENSRLQEVQSVFQWYDLEFYSDFDKKTYPIERVGGHVGWKREGTKQIFAGDNLLINFPNHLWPATTFYVALVPAEEESSPAAVVTKPAEQVATGAGKHKTTLPAAAPNSYSAKLNEGLALAEEGVKKSFASDHALRLQELRIGYLNLQDLVPIVVANAGLPQEVRKNLRVLDPLGEVQNLALTWQGGLTVLDKMSVSGEFRGLTFNPWRQLPGLANVTGKLEWQDGSGKAQIASKALSFALPALFEENLVFDQLHAAVDFEHKADEGWSFKTRKAEIVNADLQLKTDLQMVFPLKGSPHIDLQAEFALATLTQVAHYLPARVMDAALVAWLKDAFLSGRLDSGVAHIQGKLNEFPFDKGDNARLKKKVEGSFEVSGELHDVDFHYAPQWPILQQATGKLKFAGHSMQVVIDSALILDVPLKQVTGFIPALGTAQPTVVKVQANVATDLAQSLDFIHQSPLEAVLGKDLVSLQLQGPMNLALTLSIPLSNPDETTVAGKAQLSQGVLNLPEWNFTLDHLQGDFEFTEQELRAKQLQGMLWGEPAVLRLSTVLPTPSKPSYVLAALTGKVNSSNLQSGLKSPLLAFLSGTTAYQAQLKLYKSGAANNEVSLSSNLQGIAVNLPQPFGKPAPLKRDFALNVIIQQKPGFKVQLKYDNLIQAQLNIMQQQNSRVIDIDSSQVKGRVTLAYPFDAQQLIQAQFDQLIINAGNEKTIASINPHELPPLSITSKQFIYGNKNLGQLNLTTLPKANGMTIQNFSLNTADYVFQARGQWVVANREQQSQLQGTINSARVNKFLERMGLSLRSLIVDKGRATFDLRWKGAPYSFSLATTSGEFSFALERGRIINLNESDNNKMDMGRMLSLFSLQTIPRRLSLDFSDLFEKGYSFDFMRGDFSLRQGSAFTQKPAVFEGPVAHVAASGRIGLLAQDYDLNLSISPYVTESLPIVAGALTLNPFVGAAAWLVNKVVLSKEVSKVITYNYKVTGSWDSPVWQSIKNGKK